VIKEETIIRETVIKEEMVIVEEVTIAGKAVTKTTVKLLRNLSFSESARPS
jgi:hypothetical protein